MPAPGDQYRDTKASVNPFEEHPPHVNEYTAQEIATLQSRLDRQLGPEYISTRPGAGGGKVHYLAAEKVINLANEVFGFNGWSSAIQQVQIDFVDESESSGKITLGLSIIVRVTLKDGSYHEDIGYGHIENCKGKAAAFEKAKKEAATDALKRALRNFGNVLGNCLYDKDYLQRITKIKMPASKWDAENLHRHHDYAPAKKEAMNAADAARAGRPMRLPSAQSTKSNGTEFGEDEFGGDVFDEADFSHPDEVRIDASTTDVAEDKSYVNGATRQGVSRVQSMPGLRQQHDQQNGQQGPRPPQQVQQPPRPPGPSMPNNNHNNQAQRQNQAPNRTMPPPPGNAATHQHPGNQTYQGQHAQQNQQNGSRSTTPSSAGESNVQGGGAPTRNPQSRPLDNTNRQMTPPQQHDHQPNNHPPGEPAVGFVTGRAAGAGTVQPFNPHAESPSIRRTMGVNPNKSEPIKRTALGATVTPAPAPLPTTTVGPSNGPVAPAARPNNFVNPAADTTRRIGAPGGGGMASPLGNRGSYKPHTTFKRPAPQDTGNGNARSPLADMSNMQQMDGAGEVKKLKVEAVPQGQNQQNQANAGPTTAAS